MRDERVKLRSYGAQVEQSRVLVTSNSLYRGGRGIVKLFLRYVIDDRYERRNPELHQKYPRIFAISEFRHLTGVEPGNEPVHKRQ